jgi:hypothetical protein
MALVPGALVCATAENCSNKTAEASPKILVMDFMPEE